MVYRGHIKNGVVVFEDPIPLPEGAEVQVEPVNGNPSTLAKRFKDIIGCAKGLPSDLAKNHDHYLHGTPKK